MKIWQYQFVNIADMAYDQEGEILNLHGSQGWEVVSSEDTGHGIRYLMKRENGELVIPATR